MSARSPSRPRRPFARRASFAPFAVLASLGTLAILTAPRSARADDEVPAASPPAAASTPPAATAAKPEAARDAGKTVTVELQASSTRATIEKRVGTTSLPALPFSDTSFGSVSHWESACIAPCELKLDPHYAYRVAGDGLTPSDSFALPRSRDRVTLSAEMGSSPARLAGMALTAVGTGTTLLGGTALLISPVLESQDVGSKGFRTAMLAGGAVFVAAGVLELGLGLYLWMSNGTTVRADHGVLSAKAGPVEVTPAGVIF